MIRVRLDDQVIDSEFSTLELFDAFWRTFTADLDRRGRMIHYVTIDGEDYYHEYEQIIVQNFESIQNLSIKSITYQDALNDTIAELKRYNENMLAAVNQVASPFYGEPLDEDWNLFKQFCAGLEWMYQAIAFSQSLRDKQGCVTEKEICNGLDNLYRAIPGLLSSLEASLLEKNWTSVADCLLYEVEASLEQFHTVLKGMESIDA